MFGFWGSTALSSPMSVTFLGSATTTAGATSVVTLAAAVAVGAFICVGVAAHDDGTVDTITDSKSNTWTQQVASSNLGALTGGTTNFVASCWTSQLTTALASGDTITLTRTSSLNGSISVYAIKTTSGTLALNGTVQLNTGSGTTAVGPTAVTAAKTGQAYVCFACLENGQSPGLTAGDSGNGWALDNIVGVGTSSTSTSITGIVSQSQIASNTAGRTTSITLNTARPYAVFIATFTY